MLAIGALAVAGPTWRREVRSYTVYPQRPGDYEVSGIEVDVPYSTGGAAGTTARVSVNPLRFEATLPPGTERLSYFIATSRLDIEQEVRAGAGDTARAPEMDRQGRALADGTSVAHAAPHRRPSRPKQIPRCLL